MGIMTHHAYSIIGAINVDRFKLIKIRNPHGSAGWTGDWGRSSPLWNQHPHVKDILQWHAQHDNFYMSFEDFCRNFDNLQVSHKTMCMGPSRKRYLPAAGRK